MNITYISYTYLTYLYIHTYNAWSSKMTEGIFHLIGHKLSQFQALSGRFGSKKLKII